MREKTFCFLQIHVTYQVCSLYKGLLVASFEVSKYITAKISFKFSLLFVLPQIAFHIHSERVKEQKTGDKWLEEWSEKQGRTRRETEEEKQIFLLVFYMY